jgi:DNA-binding response OmpR family regulator
MSDEIHPDLIVLDAEVIEETDWTSIARLKSEWPQTTILVLTENDKQGKQAKEAGADHFLPKGFPAAELVNLIKNSLIQHLRDETNHS